MLLGVKAVQTHQTLSFYRMSWICALDDDIPILLAHTKQIKAVSQLTSFVCVSFVCVFLCCCICHVSMNVHDPTNDW